MLAQMGAKVTKIESLKRMDYMRNEGPKVDGASVLFHQLNHNKTCLIFDYESPQGIDKVFELIKNADILVEQFRPGAMDAWGFSYNELQQINPKLIYVSLTGYSQNSNYKNEAGHDLNFMAYSGVLSLIKDELGKPVVSGTQFSDIAGAYLAIIAVQSALIKRNKTGVGEYLNVSLANAMNPFLTIPFALHKSGMPHQQVNLLNGNTVANYSVYRCADNKWIALAAFEMKFWNLFCEIVEKEEWQSTSVLNLANAQFDKEKIKMLFETKERDEWIKFFKNKDVCIAPVLEIEELEESEYHISNKSFKTFTTENGEELLGISLRF